MGNMRPIDSAVVKNETYDVLSADTMGGEYIETIGAACQNPDGYTSGSLFLGKDNDVQHLYRATAAIAFGETIILDTNCVYTTVSGELGGKAEESEVSSLNEALTNVEDVINNNGAKNLLPNTATSQTVKGITFTVNSDGSVTCQGTLAAGENFASIKIYQEATHNLKSGTYHLSGCPSTATSEDTCINIWDSNADVKERGNGADFTIAEGRRFYVAIIVYENLPTPITFKPMLTLASQPNSDYAHYVPYAMTNRELTNAVTMNCFSPSVNISGYVESSPYVCPSDGYVRMAVKGNVKGLVCIEGADGVTTGSAYLMIGTSQPLNDSTSTVLRFSCPVYKGMRVYCQDNVAEALFIPLKV